VLFTLLLLFNSVTDVSTIEISNGQYNMTRFASLGQNRASDYATAGRVVANEASKAFDATRSFNPNYTDLAVQGMKARNYEKRAAWAAQEKMAKSGIKAVAGVQETKVISDARADISNTQTKSRKAGKLAAMGGLIAKAAITPRKVERPAPVTTDYSGKKTSAQKAIDEAQQELDNFNQGNTTTTDSSDVATGPTTPSTNTSGTPSQNAFSGDPSTFMTGNTGRSTGPHLDIRVWSISKGAYVDPHSHIHHVTAPGGGSLVDSYPQTSPYLENRGSYIHQGIDYGIEEGTPLNVNLPFTDSYWDNSGGGNMSIYQLPDPDLELVLMHGQGSK